MPDNLLTLAGVLLLVGLAISLSSKPGRPSRTKKGWDRLSTFQKYGFALLGLLAIGFVLQQCTSTGGP
jgi:hypothetical protein